MEVKKSEKGSSKIMETVNYKDLVAIGFPEHTSRNIIRQAKKIAVKKFEEARKNDKNAVQLGCSPFDNKRLGIAPKNIVENLIGISFSDIEGEKNGYIKDKEI